MAALMQFVVLEFYQAKLWFHVSHALQSLQLLVSVIDRLCWVNCECVSIIKQVELIDVIVGAHNDTWKLESKTQAVNARSLMSPQANDACSVYGCKTEVWKLIINV